MDTVDVQLGFVCVASALMPVSRVMLKSTGGVRVIERHAVNYQQKAALPMSLYVVVIKI